MKTLILLALTLPSISAFALDNCLDLISNGQGAVYQCDGTITNADLKTYYSSTKDGATIDEAVVCLFEKSTNIDYNYDTYVPELKYIANISYNRSEFERVTTTSNASVNLRNDNSFVHGQGTFKLREAKNDPNINDEVYKIKFNKTQGTLSLFHGTNSYLSWSGIKYAAHVSFTINHCHQVRN